MPRLSAAPLELYDLARDPGETRDLATARPEVVREIETYLAGARPECSYRSLLQRR